jgi:hypothetical protein
MCTNCSCGDDKEIKYGSHEPQNTVSIKTYENGISKEVIVGVDGFGVSDLVSAFKQAALMHGCDLLVLNQYITTED